MTAVSRCRSPEASMLYLRKPAAETISAFLADQAGLGLTYSPVGATAGIPLPGYDVSRGQVPLGKGEKVFDAARAALESWQHFRLGWVEVWPPDTLLQVGAVVAVLARQVGLWWLNACRIVYLVDEEGPVRRFGFAYGTLPDHVESGEERFLVEWDRGSGGVCYDIVALSRPRHVLAQLAYPWTRRVQARFRRDSA